MNIFNRVKKVEWEKSPAHLDFLSHFIEPRLIKPNNKLLKWEEPMGESVEAAITRFINEGVLIKTDEANQLIAVNNSAELKKLLQTRKIPSSGTKELMAKRLVDIDPKGVKKILTGKEVLICSEKGKMIAQQYKENEIIRKKTAIELSKHELIQGNYRKAVLIQVDYDAKCVFHGGLGGEWDKQDTDREVKKLQFIFSRTPQLILNRGWDKTQNTRVIAGMIELWGNTINAGITCDPLIDNAACAFVSHAHFLYEVDEAKKIGSKYLVVAHCNDSLVCKACKEVEDKKFYLINVPEFPLADCENEKGCRCSVNMVFR